MKKIFKTNKILFTLIFLAVSACTPKKLNQVSEPNFENSKSTQQSTPQPANSNTNQQSPLPSKQDPIEETPIQKPEFDADWSLIRPLPFVNDMCFLDFNTGWVVGDAGSIKRTTNAGSSWISVNKGDKDLYSVSFINKDIGWVAGAEGVIYKTTNGGDKWVPQDSNVYSRIEKIQFADENNGIFISSSDFFRTQDGGETWEIISESTGPGILDFTYLTDTKGILYSWSSYFAQLYNNGVLTPIRLVEVGSIHGVTFKDSNTGYMFGRYQFLKTTDGGKSWKKVEKVVTEDKIYHSDLIEISGLDFSSATHGVMILPQAYSAGEVLYTVDGGESWQRTKAVLPDEGFVAIRDFILFQDINHGWAHITLDNGISGFLARLGNP